MLVHFFFFFSWEIASSNWLGIECRDPFVTIDNVTSPDPVVIIDIDSLFTSQLAFLQELNWKLFDCFFSKI